MNPIKALFVLMCWAVLGIVAFTASWLWLEHVGGVSAIHRVIDQYPDATGFLVLGAGAICIIRGLVWLVRASRQ